MSLFTILFMQVISTFETDQRHRQRFNTQTCRIASLNVNGLRKNNEIKVLPLITHIFQHKYDIFMINETWAKSFKN